VAPACGKSAAPFGGRTDASPTGARHADVQSTTEDAIMAATNGLHSATKEDILTALRTEAFTYARSMLFAAAARRNGRTEVADLFESTARIELEEHFAKLATLAGIVGDDAENLRAAIEAESYEIEVMYPTFAEHASRATDSAAAEAFSQIRRHEIDHLEALREALIDIT
jgi:rubrerythrin